MGVTTLEARIRLTPQHRYLLGGLTLGALLAVFLVFSGIGSPQWYRPEFDWKRLILLVGVVPIMEEWIFRGWLFDEVTKRTSRVTRSVISQAFSPANLVTTALFCGLHLVTRGPMAALLVLMPSLYLGSMRANNARWVHCAALHSLWNALWFSVMPTPL
jgi:membrane protease YdiL (CAAX protease family)